MQIAQIVIRQTLVMFLYMLAGFVLFKIKKMTVQGSRDIASTLVYLIIPAVLVNSFCVEFSAEKLKAFLLSALLGAISIFLAIVISRLLFPKAPIDNFASAFSNAGFIGIPLVQAALGPTAVFYLVGIIAMLNVGQWTYGVGLLTGKKSATSLKSILLNPIMIGALIGLVLFLTGLGSRVPEIIRITLQGISSLNGPLAMLVLGCYLAQTEPKKLVTTPRLYWMSAVRLLLIPLATLLVFWPLPIASEIKYAVFIAASAPVGANVAVYAQLHGKDYPYACQTVALTTLLSIVTLPLMVMAAGLLF